MLQRTETIPHLPGNTCPPLVVPINRLTRLAGLATEVAVGVGAPGKLLMKVSVLECVRDAVLVGLVILELVFVVTAPSTVSRQANTTSEPRQLSDMADEPTADRSCKG